MGLDGFTIRNLEIFKSLSTQGTHGTLIDVLDQTITSGGGRLLKQWMNKPLVDRKKINSRLDIVEAFYNDFDLRDEISKLLMIHHINISIYQLKFQEEDIYNTVIHH